MHLGAASALRRREVERLIRREGFAACQVLTNSECAPASAGSEGAQEQPGKSKHAGGKGHKDGKHHKGHHDHHKDKGPKDGKDSKFKSADKEHGPKGKFKGDKPFKDGKPGKKHGGKGPEGAAPKVFGAHAPKGKTV